MFITFLSLMVTLAPASQMHNPLTTTLLIYPEASSVFVHVRTVLDSAPPTTSAQATVFTFDEGSGLMKLALKSNYA
jgi:hypothetical protein